MRRTRAEGTRKDSSLPIEIQQQIVRDLENPLLKSFSRKQLVDHRSELYYPYKRAVQNKINRLRLKKKENPKEYWRIVAHASDRSFFERQEKDNKEEEDKDEEDQEDEDEDDEDEDNIKEERFKVRTRKKIKLETPQKPPTTAPNKMSAKKRKTQASSLQVVIGSPPPKSMFFESEEELEDFGRLLSLFVICCSSSF